MPSHCRDELVSVRRCFGHALLVPYVLNVFCNKLYFGFSAGISTRVRKNVFTSYLNFPLKSLRLLYASCPTLLT